MNTDFNRSGNNNKKLTWWSTREHQLDSYTNQVHVAKAVRKNRYGSRRTKYEESSGGEEGANEVHDAIRKPCQNVQEGILIRRKHVAQVCAIYDILESWKNANPDVRTNFSWDKSEYMIRF